MVKIFRNREPRADINAAGNVDPVEVSAIDRRGPSRRRLLIGAGLLSASALLTACGGGEETPAPSASESAPAPAPSETTKTLSPEREALLKSLSRENQQKVLDEQGPEAYKKLFEIPASSVKNREEYMQAVADRLTGVADAGMSVADFKEFGDLSMTKKGETEDANIKKYDSYIFDAMGINFSYDMRVRLLNNAYIMSTGDAPNGYTATFSVESTVASIPGDTPLSGMTTLTLDDTWPSEEKQKSIGIKPEDVSLQNRMMSIKLMGVKAGPDGNLRPTNYQIQVLTPEK